MSLTPEGSPQDLLLGEKVSVLCQDEWQDAEITGLPVWVQFDGWPGHYFAGPLCMRVVDNVIVTVARRVAWTVDVVIHDVIDRQMTLEKLAEKQLTMWSPLPKWANPAI